MPVYHPGCNIYSLLLYQRPTPGSKIRPASTLGFLPDSPNSKLALKTTASKSNEDLLDGEAPVPPEWLAEFEEGESEMYEH